MRIYALLLCLLLAGCGAPPPDTLNPKTAKYEECIAISQEYQLKAAQTWNVMRSNAFMLRAIYWQINARRIQNDRNDQEWKQFYAEWQKYSVKR